MQFSASDSAGEHPGAEEIDQCTYLGRWMFARWPEDIEDIAAFSVHGQHSTELAIGQIGIDREVRQAGNSTPLAGEADPRLDVIADH